MYRTAPYSSLALNAKKKDKSDVCQGYHKRSTRRNRNASAPLSRPLCIRPHAQPMDLSSSKQLNRWRLDEKGHSLSAKSFPSMNNECVSDVVAGIF